MILALGGIGLADQLTKAWVLKTITLNSVGFRFWGDFLWIVHTRNLGIAFSIGDGLNGVLRTGLFIILPLIFLVLAVLYCARSKDMTGFQRLAISILAGGGFGNLIDRILRPDGVVDFISFKFYGILGMERFPTFNVADMCISVGAVLVLLSGLGLEWGKKDGKRD
ncbi:MAG TPA: signal peptidase II [Rectinemataceae bacterium]